MTPVERQHIIAAYSFELGKCYEQAVKERGLRVLANIDPELCAGVATALGLPAPEPSEPLATVDPSPALSQIGQTWPLDGRVIGIVADAGCDLDGVRSVRQAVFDAGMVPLVVAPSGGTLGDGGEPVTAQRTFATARSIEFDAVLLAGAPGPAADAAGALDAKAGDPATAGGGADPRVLLMLSEAYRHGKAIGGWAGAESVLTAAGVPTDAPGVVTGDSGDDTLAGITRLLGSHRVWERFA
jgi:catalase